MCAASVVVLVIIQIGPGDDDGNSLVAPPRHRLRLSLLLLFHSLPAVS